MLAAKPTGLPSRTPLVPLPVCSSRWWHAALADTHPHRRRHHGASAAVHRLPATPASALIRDQLGRLLRGIRKLAPPSEGKNKRKRKNQFHFIDLKNKNKTKRKIVYISLI